MSFVILGSCGVAPAAGGIGDVPASVDSLFRLILTVAVVICAAVVGSVAVLVIRHRRQAGVEPQAGDRVGWRTQAGVAGGLFVVLAAIFLAGIGTYAELITPPGNPYEVYVTAQDAKWTFQHRNGKVQDDGQLFVPAGRPVRMIMDSRDASYSLTLPELRIKQQIFPDRETSLWFQAPAGEYRLGCDEYCGDGTTEMSAVMTAFGPDGFDQAIASIAFWLDSYTNDRLHFAGLRLYSNCASCHTLDGSALIGPSFREVHERWGTMRQLEDGSQVMIDADYVRQSILNPQSQRAAGYTGQVMTEFAGQFRDRELTALVEFIRRLDEVVDAQGNPLPEPEQTEK